MKIRLGGEWGINSSVHPSQKVGGETRKQRCCSADKCLFCCVRVGERYGMVHLVKQETGGRGRGAYTKFWGGRNGKRSHFLKEVVPSKLIVENSTACW